MYRALVISDSHGNAQRIIDAINSQKFDGIFYLGDGLRDLVGIDTQIPIYKVSGNCDIFAFEPDQEYMNVENHKILLTHGHVFKVKYGLNRLVEYAKQGGFDVVCYGHTHIQNAQRIDNILFINPGSISVGYMAILEMDNGIVNYILKKEK